MVIRRTVTVRANSMHFSSKQQKYTESHVAQYLQPPQLVAPRIEAAVISVQLVHSASSAIPVLIWIGTERNNENILRMKPLR